MSIHTPILPVNVQAENPYAGLDRGLFVLQGADRPFARMQVATWRQQGPATFPGYVVYQVMTYATQPQTEADYQGGQIYQHPVNGLKEFIAFTRGVVETPIQAEYWATEDFLNKTYDGPVEDQVTQQHLDTLLAKSKAAVQALSMGTGLIGLDYQVKFAALGGKPLNQVARSFALTRTTDKGTETLTLPAPTSAVGDPVQYAVKYLKSHSA